MSDQLAGLQTQLADGLGKSPGLVPEGDTAETDFRTIVGGKRKLEKQPGMEIEEGVLSGAKPELGHVFVVAEESPSLLLLLGTTSWDSVSCCCPFELCNWLIRDSAEPWKFIDSLEDLGAGARSLGGERKTFLVQGASQSFISEALATFHDAFDESTDKLLVVGSKRVRKQHSPQSNWNLLWTSVRHCDVGGVTNKSFRIGLHAPTRSTSEKPTGKRKVQRFVRGLQKVDIGGDECSAPENATLGPKDTLLNPSSHVTPLELLGTFRLKSVFSKSSWVATKLTNREVSAAWDLPPDRIKKMEAELLLGRLTTSALVHSPPLKILQEALSLLFPAVPSLDTDEGNSGSLSSSDSVFKLSTFIPATTIREVKVAHSKAVKNDNAATETDIWDQACVAGFDPMVHGPLFEFLHSCSVSRFVENVAWSFEKYLHLAHNFIWTKDNEDNVNTRSELGRDLAPVGKDAFDRAKGSSFWSWDLGSKPFFWRWQPEVQKDMQGSSKLFVIKSKLPRYHRKQDLPRDKTILRRITEKIQKVYLRGCITVGLVISLTSFFHVPNGEDNIRMVYDATACGLNDALWAPGFWMLTIMNVLDCATAESWFGDVDVAEMFLNYLLDVDVRPYAGIDVSGLNEDGSSGQRWERWTRMAMGMSPSPFVTIRLFAWAMEIILGDHTDPANHFHWSEIQFNCPGSPNYDPSLPRCYKWNDVKKCIAADCVTFVDDLRTIGACFALVQAATHRVETMMGYLGLQDSSGKLV